MPTVNVSDESLEMIEEIQERGYDVMVQGEDGKVVEEYRLQPSKRQVVEYAMQSHYDYMMNDEGVVLEDKDEQ